MTICLVGRRFFCGPCSSIIYNAFRLLWRRLAGRRVGRLIQRSHNGKSSRNRVAVARACLLSMKISERFRVGHLPGVCPRKKPASKTFFSCPTRKSSIRATVASSLYSPAKSTILRSCAMRLPRFSSTRRRPSLPFKGKLPSSLMLDVFKYSLKRFSGV